jgi:hypothetical protein
MWVYPHSADIVLQIEGQSSVSTSQAMKKAKEVEQLIAELDHAGVSDVPINVDSVSFESSKNLLGGSSQAVFRVVVVGVESDKVPLCLGVGANKKGVSIEACRWSFGKLHDERLQLLRLVASDCRDYADTIAKSLGITRGLLHSSNLDWGEPEDVEPYVSKRLLMRSRSGVKSSDGGFSFPVQRRSLLSVSMRAEFRCVEA